MRSLKHYLRDKLIACEPCYAAYTRWKYRVSNTFELRFHLHDALNSFKHMHWAEDPSLAKNQLQAKLLFYYHKIEKGMCMPGKKRLFGLDAVPRIIGMLSTWEVKNFPTDDPIYLGAIASLHAYRNVVHGEKLDPQGAITSLVDEFLGNRMTPTIAYDTPIAINAAQIPSAVSFEALTDLYLNRRSVRSFANRPVDREVITRAVKLAQLSPSACNRQPCKVWAIEEPALKTALLKHQNGNAGFGHLAPVILVVSADSNHFFGPIERHQPFVDGGMFVMSLLYALQTQGIVSCCLNWCNSTSSDKAAHRLLDMPPSERIIMFIAIGHPESICVVPKSHRKSTLNIVSFR